MTRVLVTRVLPEPALTLLEQAGFDLVVNRLDRALTPAELRARIAGCQALVSQLADRIDRDLLDAAPDLRIIATFAVGVDNIDRAECARRGITVCNTPDVLTNATAELAWALLFAAARRIAESDRYVRAGKFRAWAPTLMLGTELAGKTLGVVGAGRIGTAFALKAAGLGMRVLYADEAANPVLESRLNAIRVELDELLREADFVSLHVPLTPATRHLLNRERLAAMKPGAILVNAARGPVVDEAALAEVLRDGPLAAAGLDVYEHEPAIDPGLLALDNVVLVPHIGSATHEARSRMARLVAQAVVDFFAGRTPRTVVALEKGDAR